MKASICVVGLGYVGLPLAVYFAQEGHDVIGLDVNEKKLAELAAGHDSMLEVEDEELAKAPITYTSDASNIAQAEFVIITVPTPVDQHNNPDLTLIRKASATVGKHLAKGSTVILESTVYPGVTEEVVAPMIESISGLVHNEDFFLGYSPERVNPGDKEHTIDKVIKVVSGSTPQTLERVAALYETICKAGVHKAPTIRVAESAKVIENVQRDLNIALMNELALIFDRLDINVHDVLDAAGTKWNFRKYTPGLVGGHCIGVDPYYLTHKAREAGYHPEIILAGRRLNDNMHSFFVEKLIKALNKNGVAANHARVAVLGVTFKEDCSDYRNSRTLHLLKDLKEYGVKSHAIDPWVSHEIIETFDATPVDLETFKRREWDAAIITVPHSQFSSLNFDNIPVVIDVKGKPSPVN